MKFDSHLLHMCDSNLRQVGIQHRQHMIQRFHHCDPGTEACISTGNFQSDYTASDDNHGFRKVIQ